VKVVGSGHSFTAVALTDGHLVQLDNYQRVLKTDAVKGQVTVEAGIKLHRLNEELDRRGLAMPNLGDIDRQSISGAIATSTHGTARDLGGIARDIVGMRLIADDGSILDCSAGENADIFQAARVGVGALGVVSTVTIQAVPAFNLHAREVPMDVDDVLANLDDHIASNDHFEFYWVPGTRWAISKFNNRTSASGPKRGAWHQFRDDILFSNAAFWVVCRAGRLRPSIIPRVAKIMPNAGATEYVDKSYKVFCTPRMVRFYEMEYAIPFEAAREAFNRVRDYITSSSAFPSKSASLSAMTSRLAQHRAGTAAT
jgi:L-gulonolactone oxidase